MQHSNKSSPKIIVFSGIDGCGKSTQIRELAAYLKKIDRKHIVIWARPGSTPILMKLKKIARSLLFFLPSEGRSEERDKLLKRKIGRLWFYLSLVELIYIYRIKSVLLALLGYIVICDRHLLDSFIDFKIMGLINSDEKYINIFLSSLLIKADKFFFEISVDESVRRCEMKWEPYPDTIEEKIKRMEYYRHYLPMSDYIILNGFDNSENLHAKVISIII